VAEAGIEFHALCEGLAGVELRRQMVGVGERLWSDALSSLVAGWMAQRDPPP
jgi:hypothetical protein